MNYCIFFSSRRWKLHQRAGARWRKWKVTFQSKAVL